MTVRRRPFAIRIGRVPAASSSAPGPGLAFAIAGATALTFAAGFVACGREPAVASRLSLASRLGSVAIERDAYPLAMREVELGFDRRKVLFQHPPSRIRFPAVPNPPGAVIKLAPALDPAVWDKPTDGAHVRASCGGPLGAELLLLDERVQRSSGPAREAKWVEQSLPLRRCSTPVTDLVLETDCGEAARCDFDWVVWADPHLEWRGQFTTRVPRLVLLVSIDTLRADRLPAAGGRAGISPELDRLALDSVSFHSALAHSPWTLPSHASLLSSTDPLVHRTGLTLGFPARLPLLAERFREAGWQTAAFVDAPWLVARYGLNRGFQLYDDQLLATEARRGSERGAEALRSWLESAGPSPAFVFWHLMDVHGPYGAPAPFGGSFERAPADWPLDPRMSALARLDKGEYLQLPRFRTLDDLKAAYDEGFWHVDAVIGEILQLLRLGGLYDSSIIAVVSDHGETQLDRGGWIGHGFLLNGSEIHVPWILKLGDERWRGKTVGEMVRLLDVAPTLLDAAGLTIPGSFQGQSLLGALSGDAPFPRASFGWSETTGATYVQSGGWKLISPATSSPEEVSDQFFQSPGAAPSWFPDLLSEQLYQLDADPDESSNRLAETGDVLRELRELLARHRRESDARWLALDADRAAPALSEEERRRLAALGYLNP